jgi:integrase
MSIRKQADGTYLVEIYVGARRTRRTAVALKEAKRIEQEIRTAPVSPDRGLEEALKQHLTGGAKALRDYRKVCSVALFLGPYIKGKTLRDAGQVADDIKRALTGHVTNSTINRKLALLRHICNLAYQWGWTEVPVGMRVKLLPENPQRHVYLSLEQVEALAKLCPRGGNIVSLAAYTGLRRGELLRLERTNVQGAVIVVDAHTKSGRPRAVPVPAVAMPLLAEIPFACTYGVLRGEFEAARGRRHAPRAFPRRDGHEPLRTPCTRAPSLGGRPRIRRRHANRHLKHKCLIRKLYQTCRRSARYPA